VDVVMHAWSRRSPPGTVAATSFVAIAILLLAGCVATRSASFGPLPDNESLVTLVVSEDSDVVRRECRDVPALSRILGCQTSKVVRLPHGDSVRAVKIVRFTDALPSALAFEIDIHELCHAIAAVQGLADPCHGGNGGVVESDDARSRVTIR
jgi:hypothetical protein